MKLTAVVKASTYMESQISTRCLYKSLYVGFYAEADGKRIKHRLKIGSKTMNVLITLSVHLNHIAFQDCIDIGPDSSSIPQTISPHTYGYASNQPPSI